MEGENQKKLVPATGGGSDVVATMADQTVAEFHPHLDPRRKVTKPLPGLALVHKRKLLNDEGRKLSEAEAMVRSRKQRDFKEDFKPADFWGGRKEGYYFSTGTRGTGYYLDSMAFDVNDPDEDGYVLVRTSPAVAVHRALPKWEAARAQGLLYSSALLAALGPAHGEPAHRYKLATAPWMGGMRPPRETFEKGDELSDQRVTGRNELLHERYEYLAARVASLLRETDGGGNDPDDDDDCRERIHAVSEHRELALFRSPTDVVTVEARGGPLELRGDDLAPVLPNDGPWTFLLELGGPDAATRPFAFKATLKRASLTKWPAAKLLAVFAEKHNAKYDAFVALDPARLRLHVSEGHFAATDTILAELVADWTGPIAARLVVKPKLGAGTDARELVSARSTALAERRDLHIDDWSTQEQVVRARAQRKDVKGPMTSQEIRDYWEQHKNDKHWRTDAALRGYATRTDDPAKLHEWKTNRLVKNKGFLNKEKLKPPPSSSNS